MVQILSFLPRETSFDAECVAHMGEAFDRACEQIRADQQSISVKEALAVHIIRLAQTGRHDPDWLCSAAIVALLGVGSAPN
jgi:hypothetical protein